MKTLLMTTAATLALAGAAQAGGYDRSGQPLSFMFETGTYVELTYGYGAPSLSSLAAPASNVTPSYSTLGFAYKRDLGEKLSLGVQLDQPFGAHVQYAPTSPIGPTYAELWSTSLNVIGRYKLDGGLSVHGGLRYVSVDGRAFVPPRGVSA